jgi:hypothetical protein
MITLALSVWLIPKFYLIPLFFGYVGWTGVARRAAPAEMIVPAALGHRDEITAWLKKNGFTQSSGADCWAPYGFRPLQWRHAPVRMSKTAGGLLVAGPATYLYDIREHLKRRVGPSAVEA